MIQLRSRILWRHSPTYSCYANGSGCANGKSHFPETVFRTHNLTRYLAAFSNFTSRYISLFSWIAFNINKILGKHTTIKFWVVNSCNGWEPTWGQFNGCWDASSSIPVNKLFRAVDAWGKNDYCENISCIWCTQSWIESDSNWVS